MSLEDVLRNWRRHGRAQQRRRNAMELGFHRVRTYWNPGFSTLRLGQSAQHKPHKPSLHRQYQQHQPETGPVPRRPVPARQDAPEGLRHALERHECGIHVVRIVARGADGSEFASPALRWRAGGRSRRLDRRRAREPDHPVLSYPSVIVKYMFDIDKSGSVFAVASPPADLAAGAGRLPVRHVPPPAAGRRGPAQGAPRRLR